MSDVEGVDQANRGPWPIVFGILNVVWACIGFFYCLWVFVRLHLASLKRRNIPYAATMAHFPIIGTLQLSIAFAMFLLGLILIAGGVGLMMRKNWGRKLSAWYVVLKLLLIAANEAVFIYFIVHQWPLIAVPEYESKAIEHITFCAMVTFVSLFYPIALGIWLWVSQALAKRKAQRTQADGWVVANG